MEIKEIEFLDFGKCVRISNEIIDVVVTIDCGPRIVRFGYRDCENVFYTDTEKKHCIRDESLSACCGENAAFYYYGGHRVSLSPERMPQTYYPDNSPVVYSILPDGVSFTSAKQKQSEIQVGFEVVMGEDAADIMVVHTAKNCAKETQTCSLHPVTMMKSGGLAVVPLNSDGSNSLLPNQLISLWPGTDLHDGRIRYGKRFLSVKCESGTEQALKIGTNNILGWAAYIENDFTLMKRYVHNAQAAYPDFGCSFETRSAEDFAELGSLSPLYRLEPGERIRHVENLSLYRTQGTFDPADEDSVGSYIDGLIG